MKSSFIPSGLLLLAVGLVGALLLALLSPAFHTGPEFLALLVGGITVCALGALALLGRPRHIAAFRSARVSSPRAIAVVSAPDIAWRARTLRARDRLAA